MSQDQWYYSKDGVHEGPVSRAEIIRLIETGDLPPAVLVCQKGSMNWQPIRDVPSFQQTEIYPGGKPQPTSAGSKPPSQASGQATSGSSEIFPSGSAPASAGQEDRMPGSPARRTGSGSLMGMLNKWPKPVFFGLVGALGCLSGAVLGEMFLALFPDPKPENKPTLVDIMFTLDVTGSMGPEIKGIKNGIIDFADTLNISTNNLDIRMGLIAFGDLTRSETPQILSFDEGSPFTTNAVDFSREVGTIRMVGGHDEPESSYDAVALAAKQPFRPDSKKTIVLITDASPQRGITVSNTVDILREHKIEYIHLVINERHLRNYKPLQTGANGKVFPLSEAAGGRQSFDRILEGIAIEIIAANPPIGLVDKTSDHPLLTFLNAAGWFALIAVFLALALGVAQNSTLLVVNEGRMFRWGQAIICCVIGLLAGFAAGLINLGFVMVSDKAALSFIGGVVAWTVLGGAIGFAMVFVILNFKPSRAIVGGLIGGLMGGLVFNLLRFLGDHLGGSGSPISDGIGRLIGAVMLGAIVGCFIAVVERLSREAYIVIHWGPNETSTLNLGQKPVTIGGREDSVFVNGIPDGSLSIVLDEGRITCTQQPGDNRSVLKDQSRIDLGKVEIVVHAKS
jgi:Ca-activated chloride channel family protein